jgi:hypothetical protein
MDLNLEALEGAGQALNGYSKAGALKDYGGRIVAAAYIGIYTFCSHALVRARARAHKTS